jgi:hypothetical protein
MLEATEKTGDIMLRYAFQKDMFKQSLLKQQEIEKLKKEITADVLSQISIKVEKEAIEQLKAMINSLGKGV